MTGFWEQLPGGTLARAPLNVRGRLVSRTPGDNYEDVTVSDYGPAFVATNYLPLPAALSVNQTSRTVAVLDWVPGAEGFPRAHVATWEVFRGLNGAEPELITTLDDDVLTYTDSGLPTATSPENTFAYVVYGVSLDGTRNSNTVSVQWAGTILNQPTAPTGFATTLVQPTTITFAWSETPDATVTKHGLFSGTTLLVNDIPASATSYTWAGRTASTTYSNISVRRYNAWMGGTVPGWSPGSNAVTVTTPAVAAGPLFLGDVPGQIYMGWSMSTSGPGELSYENQLNTQAPFTALAPSGVNYSNLLGVRRLFSKNTTHISHADATNRVLWISAKADEFGTSNSVAGWAAVASGSQDAQIITYFTSLVARNKLTVFTFHHEPMGDASAVGDGTTHANAHKRIHQVVNTEFPGHRIIFCPNYEENRLRNPQAFLDWSRWLPQEMMPGVNSYSWDFISYDTYQYGANTSTNPTQGVQFSHRLFRMLDILSGDFTPPGSSAMPWMTYTPGQDIRIGWGEVAHWPYWFYAWENNLTGNQMSNMTGTKYSRDMMDSIFANIDKIAFVCWFNTIGSSNVTGDTRLWPSDTGFSGDGQQPNHPSFVQQTGDTEYCINVWREKLNTGLTVKLANTGLPPA